MVTGSDGANVSSVVDELFRTFFENAPTGKAVSRPDGRFLRVNPAFAEMLGYSVEELTTLSFESVTHPEDAARSRESQKTLIAGGRDVLSMEKRYRTRMGGVVWAHVIIRIQRDPNGIPLYFLTHIEDLTERKQAELDLRTSETRLRRQRNALIRLGEGAGSRGDDLTAALQRIVELDAEALEVARVGVWLFNVDRTVLRCVDLYDLRDGRHSSGAELGAAEYPGYFDTLSRADAIVANDAQDDPRTREFLQSYLRPLGIVSMMDAPIRAGGEVRGVLCHEHVGTRREWTVDEKTFSIAMASQISLSLEELERKKAQASLAESEDALRLQSAALNAAAHAMVITNREGAIEWINPAFSALTGYASEEAIGRNPRDLLRSGVHEKAFFKDLWDTILAGKVWRGEMTNRRKDGSSYQEEQSITPVKDARGAVTHFIAIKRDLTEERRMEAQFLQAQKMEIVGRLAGGIAHDFNNLLTVINGIAELGVAALKDGDPLRSDFQQIQQAGARAAAMTRQLLAFSRKQIMKLDVLNLDALVTEMQGMLQRLIGEDINLTVVASEEPWGVRVDAGQIEQVVLNLVVNARDAMPQGGRVTIQIQNVELDETYAAVHASVRPGQYVMLSVSDTGIGMDAATQARMFEPFFTTKGPGKGTGLGLATVYGIVNQCGGTVWVYSEVGRGTTFKIYLPRIGDAARSATSAEPRPAQRGTETILVVEDEPALRTLAMRILRSAGYHVLAASGADEAVQILQRHPGRVHLMFTDMVMPGMGGQELAASLVRARPDMKVLYTSGYTDDTVLREGMRDAAANFIGKPYSRSGLTDAVRQALDRIDGPHAVTGA
ncbi:MAG TPA: PAS domain S-box protein [Vicinamibacterales bacterium]|nr:PAS domain S-box protein [Vicinamibacterales bacterium]